MTRVAETLPASAAAAIEHFARKLSLETDCDDVHLALETGHPDFILVDVRGPAAYARAHVPGAINIPAREITAERMVEWAPDTLFVVYCAGPRCNGGDKAALRLANLQRPVKLMIGGITGWADEGFDFARSSEAGSIRPANAQLSVA